MRKMVNQFNEDFKFSKNKSIVEIDRHQLDPLIQQSKKDALFYAKPHFYKYSDTNCFVI